MNWKLLADEKPEKRQPVLLGSKVSNNVRYLIVPEWCDINNLVNRGKEHLIYWCYITPPEVKKENL